MDRSKKVTEDQGPQPHPVLTPSSPMHPGSHQHRTRPSPRSRELRAAMLTRQDGKGNGAKSCAKFSSRPPQRKRPGKDG